MRNETEKEFSAILHNLEKGSFTRQGRITGLRISRVVICNQILVIGVLRLVIKARYGDKPALDFAPEYFLLALVGH